MKCSASSYLKPCLAVTEYPMCGVDNIGLTILADHRTDTKVESDTLSTWKARKGPGCQARQGPNCTRVRLKADKAEADGRFELCRVSEVDLSFDTSTLTYFRTACRSLLVSSSGVPRMNDY